jgi:hypothetical protein
MPFTAGFRLVALRVCKDVSSLTCRKSADSNVVKLDGGKIGSFDGDVGEFFGHELVDDKNVIVKFHWDKRNPKAPIYSRAFSADEGRTWEWNWYSNFSPR